MCVLKLNPGESSEPSVQREHLKLTYESTPAVTQLWLPGLWVRKRKNKEKQVMNWHFRLNED